MRHKVAGRKLGRATDQRLALLRGLVRSLITKGFVTTTVPRAKEAKRLAERLITRGKQALDLPSASPEGVHARRMVRRVLADEDLVAKVFDDLAQTYRDREGGYTRIVRVGNRRGDGVQLAKLKLMDY